MQAFFEPFLVLRVGSSFCILWDVIDPLLFISAPGTSQVLVVMVAARKEAIPETFLKKKPLAISRKQTLVTQWKSKKNQFSRILRKLAPFFGSSPSGFFPRQN